MNTAAAAATMIALVLAGGAIGAAIPSSPSPVERTISITARKYAYDPAVVRASLGDTLHFRLQSVDVTHGFYLEGFDVNARIMPNSPEVELRHPSTPDSPAQHVEEIVVVANRSGKFRFRCSHTCGFLHPFMLGELIIEPNRLFPASMGMASGLVLGGGILAMRRKKAA